MNTDRKPLARLPATEVISLVDVVDILVRAQDPRFDADDSSKTVAWEIVARRVREDVNLAAQTGALRVHRRGAWMRTGFDKNESTEYDVAVDDLAKWLDQCGMAHERAHGRESGPAAGDARAPKWTAERKQELRDERKQLVKNGSKAPTKELAEKYGVSTSRIRKLLEEHTSTADKWSGLGGRNR